MTYRSDASQWGSAINRIAAGGKPWIVEWEQVVSATRRDFEPQLSGFDDHAQAVRQYEILKAATENPEFSWCYRNPTIRHIDTETGR